MKKIPKNSVSPWEKTWGKLWRFMRIQLFFSFFILFQLSAATAMTQQRVTVSLEDVLLEDVIREVENQSGYVVVYNNTILKSLPRVSVTCKESDAASVLNEALKGSGLECRLTDGFLVILKTEVQAQTVQKREISGKVTYAGKHPLPGATVVIAGTTVGVVTDEDGHFKIVIPDRVPAVLVVSFVGMRQKTVTVEDGKDVTVDLEMDSEELEDVVVTGYTKRSKSSYAGSAFTVDSKKLEEAGSMDLISSIKGVIPGIEITQSGVVGSMPIIKIRGNNRLPEFDRSITGNSAPLFVVDGFIMNNMSNYNMLNPRDIESMTVLKDAEAMALYGSRGANGVIVISTKRGHNGRVKISAEAKAGFTMLGWNRLDVMSPRETLEWERKLYANSENLALDDPQVLAYRPESMLDNTTDWYREALSGSWATDASLSARGGNEHTTFFLQGSYGHQSGIVEGNDMDRIGVVANMQHRFGDKGDFGFNLNAYRTETENGNGANALYNQIQYMSPLIGAYDPETGELLDGTQEEFALGRCGNPLYNYAMDESNDVAYRVALGLQANVKLWPFLRWQAQVGYDLNTSRGFGYNHYTDTYLPNVTTPSGIYESHRLQNVLSVRNMLVLNKDFGNHSLNGFVSMEYQYEDSEYSNASGRLTEELKIRSLASLGSNISVTGYKDKSNFLGYVFQMEYGFRHKYFLSGSVRTDGSSRFGGNNKWGTFGSVGVAWNLKNEKLLYDVEALSRLKLRATYGKVGNANFGSSFSHYTVYSNGNKDYANKYPGYRLDHYKNENLQWETTQITNVGLDFGFLNDHLSGTIDYYYKNTSDLLHDVDLAPSIGIASQMRNTAGVKNHGLEIAINSVNFDRAFRWTTQFNISFNRNKVTRLNNGLDELKPMFQESYIIRKGEPTDNYYVPEWAGVDPQTGDALYYGKDGGKTMDYEEARKVFISSEDKFRGGLSNSFSWKGLSLGVNVLFAHVTVLDRLSMNYTDNDGNNFGGMYFRDAAKDYWQKPGDVVARPRPERWKYSGQSSMVSSRYILDGFYAKVQSMNLAWDMPSKWFRHRLNVRLFASGNNLWTIYSKHPMLDPDQGNMVSFIASEASVPTGRTWQFGINVTF